MPILLYCQPLEPWALSTSLPVGELHDRLWSNPNLLSQAQLVYHENYSRKLQAKPQNWSQTWPQTLRGKSWPIS